jgi:hypothetical protein
MLSAVWAVALAATPDAGVASAPFLWNVPQVDRVVEVGDKLEAKGLPLKVFLAHTRLKEREVFRHYYQRFVAEGFYVDPAQKPLPGLSLLRLTAFDEKRLWSYTVIFYPEADGTTTLTLGAADMSVRKGEPQKSTGEAVGLPVLPGATAVMTTSVELGRSVSFETKDAPEEVLSYYQATLPTLGWKERDKGTFVQQGKRVRVLTRPSGKVLQVVVLQDADVELPGLESGAR